MALRKKNMNDFYGVTVKTKFESKVGRAKSAGGKAKKPRRVSNERPESFGGKRPREGLSNDAGAERN